MTPPYALHSNADDSVSRITFQLIDNFLPYPRHHICKLYSLWTETLHTRLVASHSSLLNHGRLARVLVVCRRAEVANLRGHRLLQVKEFNLQFADGQLFDISIYRKVSNIRRTKCQNLNDSRLVLQLSVPNPLTPSVKSIMKL